MDSSTVTGDGRTGQKFTEEEVIEKWGSIPLDFIAYYKFIFLFEGFTPDGIQIQCSFGGTPEKIKMFHLLPAVPRSLSQFQIQEWNYIVIQDAEGRILFERRREE